MDKNIYISKICSLPLNFKIIDNPASILIKKSYFFIFQENIHPSEVENYLIDHLNLIEEWKNWSNTKPTSQGNHIYLEKDQNIIVKLDATGKEIFKKSYETSIKACAEYILIESSEILTLGSREIHFDALISRSIEIGNLTAGKPIEECLYYAEGLSQKIINHILTVKKLYDGYQVYQNGNIFYPVLDFASIMVLTRAALETYLALNYVFIAKNDEPLRGFRFLCWDLAGFIERSNFKAKAEEHVIRKENERISIENLKIKISDDPIFKSLSPSAQKKALNGDWRLNNGWRDLALNAGFGENYFKQLYKLLCNYAHASRLSVIQIQQSKEFYQQREMASSCINALMLVLAKHMHDYIELIPHLHEVKRDSERYSIFVFWKRFADNLMESENEN